MNKMKENTQEKMLMEVNKNSWFYKAKRFFRNLFSRKQEYNNVKPVIEEKVEPKRNAEQEFIDSIKIIETPEMKLEKLQKQFRSGKIKEEELSEEQITSLCQLYDKQIADLKKSNEIRKQRLLEYRKKLQTNE